ncbi:MAG: hypothetical protein Q4A61_00735, partial [Porphyromonadaceae bacterium]|nr:hypothetical protein [Porphyromonadaceae bacterium]
DERKAELSRKRAEAGSKGGKIGGKVYRPSQANSPTEDVEESKTKANAKQKESKTDAEESKTKANAKQKESKTALRGGNIGGKREKEENIFSKQSSSPQSVSVSERVGVGAGAEPRDAGRARESEAEAEASGTARQARQHDEAAMLSPGDYLDAEGKNPMAWLRESVADDGLDEYYRKMAEQRPPVGFAPSPWGNGSYGSGQALVCALKETYDQMRAENASWSDCKAITAEMMADALESVTHYGSSAAVGEVMKRATNLPFLQGKRNLQRLAWLLKLKTLSAIEEGAYTDSPTPPKPRGGAIAYPTPMRVNAAFEDIPPPPDY